MKKSGRWDSRVFLSFCFFGLLRDSPTTDLIIKNGKVFTVSDKARKPGPWLFSARGSWPSEPIKEMQKYIGRQDPGPGCCGKAGDPRA